MKKLKGIILSGGSGTRLSPATKVLSKQMLLIYDKPMIYYPLSTLIESGITEILIISTPRDISMFENLLGDGKRLGIRISYDVQPEPKGLAQALIIAENFLDGSPSVLILGDNLFFGSELTDFISKNLYNNQGAHIFGIEVHDPERYGVIETSSNGEIISLEEKPKSPKSNYAITGIYIYDNKASNFARKLKPSERGELEITDLNLEYLKNNILKLKLLKKGQNWFDTGTYDSLLEAGNFVQILQKRQGIKIGCIEEASWRKKNINDKDLKLIIEEEKNSIYGQYLSTLLRDEKWKLKKQF